MTTGGYDEHRIRAELAEVREEWQRERTPYDEDAFRTRAIAMAERSGDPDLVDAVWDYREGKIDRVALRTHPAYQRQADRELDELRDRMASSGLTQALRER